MSGEGVFAAAKCIRPYLEELLGSDAPTVDEELAHLLNSGGRDESVARQLRALLEERPETSMFLDAVLDDAPDFRPPQHQPVVLKAVKADGFNPLAGNHTPTSAKRYRCPVGDDYKWWSPGVGTPVPECPTHHTTLVTGLPRS